jgi:hypothetical protein
VTALTPAARGLLRLHLATVLADQEAALAAAREVAPYVGRGDVLDALALAYVHAGPFGMNTAVTAWRAELSALDAGGGIADPEWPDGWAFEPRAMYAGIDHRTLAMTADEAENLRSWYLRTMHEVPGHVELFLRHQPTNLKTLRVRLELAVRESLPLQLVPLCLLQVALRRAEPDAERRYRTQAEVFGATGAEVAEAVELAR